MAQTLIDGVTVTGSGNAVEVVAKLPVTAIATVIQNHHGK
jgi:hypothetical protein